MSRINQKLGLKPAGKRAIMHGAKDPALTALRCVFEDCQDTWILQNVIHGKPQRNCARCGRRQPMEPAA